MLNDFYDYCISVLHFIEQDKLRRRSFYELWQLLVTGVCRSYESFEFGVRPEDVDVKSLKK